MKRTAAWALPIFLLLACQRAPTTPAPVDPPSFQVEGRRIRVTEDAGGCALVHATAGGPEQKVKLSLAPPCHLVMWKDSPPEAKAVSDGVPVGQAGDPMAWRYPSAGGATFVAIIGDPVPERMRDDVYQRWIDQGFRCAGSVQGVALGKESVSAAPVRSQVGIFCAESGLDQAEFWLLSHPPSSP